MLRTHPSAVHSPRAALHYRQVAAGSTSTWCMATGPQLYGWGKLKASGDNTTHPMPVHDLSGWNVSAAPRRHSCLLRLCGRDWLRLQLRPQPLCALQRLGALATPRVLRLTLPPLPRPNRVPPALRAQPHSMACGPATFAVAAEKSVITWGAATNQELGYGESGKKSSANPAKVRAQRLAAGIPCTGDSIGSALLPWLSRIPSCKG